MMPTKIYTVHGGHPAPTWKQFLEVFDNKQCLIQLLCGYFSNDSQDFVHKHPAKSQYFVGGGNGEEVSYITSEGTSKPSHKFSSHEEADTQMIFHAIDADIMLEKSHEKGRIIIRSADTDVLVVVLYYYQQLYRA